MTCASRSRAALLSEAMPSIRPRSTGSTSRWSRRAGEAAGVLDNVLDRRDADREGAEDQARVRGAMIYPTVVLSFATPRPGRHAHVPGAGLRAGIRGPRRAADADPVGDGGLGGSTTTGSSSSLSASPSSASSAGSGRTLVARRGTASSSRSRCRSAVWSARSRWHAGLAPCRR